MVKMCPKRTTKAGSDIVPNEVIIKENEDILNIYRSYLNHIIRRMKYH